MTIDEKLEAAIDTPSRKRAVTATKKSPASLSLAVLRLGVQDKSVETLEPGCLQEGIIVVTEETRAEGVAEATGEAVANEQNVNNRALGGCCKRADDAHGGTSGKTTIWLV
jgi:hypothetical protein